MGVFLTAAWLPAAQAQTEVAAISLGAGAQPGQVIVNPVTNRIYILTGTSGGPNAITQIDGATHASSPIALPPIVSNSYGPLVLNSVNNRLYVANYSDSQVIVVDLANNNMTTTIQFPMVARPSRLAVNPVTGKVYVLHETGVAFVGNISVIDSNNNPTFNLLPMGGGNLFDIAINPVSNKIYVAAQSTGSVIVINGQNDTLINEITMLNSPVNVSVNPVTNLVYVLESGGMMPQNATVRVIDGSNDILTPTIVPLPSARRLTINPATNKIYVATSPFIGDGSIGVIDAANNHTVSTIPFVAGSDPRVIALNPATNQLYVFQNSSNTVMVIDGVTDMPLVTTMFGQSLQSAAVNPITNRIYFSDFMGGAQVRVIDGHTYNPGPADSINVGSNPTAVAVDPVTNRIYVANQNSADVSVIDTATGMLIMDPATGMNPLAGVTPFGVAVNPITNLAYVTNANNGNVSVINSAANKIADIMVQAFPHGVAVNPATNRIYVANSGGATVSVIDGASNINIANVAVGSAPNAVAVNLVTNRIYVTSSSNDISVIDGATHMVTSVTVGGASVAGIAVNPATNRTYVATNQNGGSIVVIDQNNMPMVTLMVPGASAIAVNPLTNRIYVGAQNTGGVTVIDGTNNTIMTAMPIPIGQNLQSIVVDQAANLIYVSAQMSGWVSVIDGASNTKLGDFPPNNGGTPRALAVNPVTGRVYATNINNDSVTVYDGLRETPLPLTTTVSLASGGNVTTANIPAFNFATTSNYAPNAPAVRTVFFQLDSLQGPWQQANGMAPNFNLMLPVPSGQHVLYAFAVDAMEGGASFDSPPIERSNILVGQLTAFPFTVAQPVAPFFTSAVPADITVLVNTSIISPPAFTAGGAPTPTITVTGLPTGVTMNPIHIISGTPSVTGTFPVTVTAANNVMPDATQTFNINVHSLPVFSNMPPPMTINVLQGVAIPNMTFNANGFPAPTLSTMSMLPTGITFDPATGLLSGTPMVMGMFPITITAMNAAGTATQTFTLNVAPPVTAFTGASIPGPGNITAAFTPNGNCSFTTSAFIGPPPVTASTGPVPVPPFPLDFPHGLFDFRIDNCPIVAGGTTVNFTITYPSALPAGTQYWKYGPTPMNPMPHWYVLPATISGVTATFSITDGGLGDDDLIANGTIVDQGGPGSLITAPVPTLSEWMLMLLGLLVMGSGVWLARRQGVFAPV